MHYAFTKPNFSVHRIFLGLFVVLLLNFGGCASPDASVLELENESSEEAVKGVNDIVDVKGEVDDSQEESLPLSVTLTPPSPEDQQRAQDKLDLAINLMSTGQNEQARALLDQAKDIDNTNANIFYQSANLFLNQGQEEDAVAEYRAARERGMTNSELVNNLGVALSFQEKFKEAVEFYESVLPDHPDDIGLHYNLGLLYFKGRNAKRALELFTAVKDLGGGVPKLHYYLGRCYRELKEYDQAIAAYKEELKFQEDEETVHNLAIAYMDQEDFDSAIRYFKRAIEMNPGYALAYNNLGNAYKRLNRKEEAVEQYKESVKLDSENGAAFFNLGLMYTEMKDFENALEAYTRAAELVPENLNFELHKRRTQRILDGEEVL